MGLDFCCQRVRCISRSYNPPRPLSPPPLRSSRLPWEMPWEIHPSHIHTGPDISSTSLNNQISSGLPIPAGDHICPVFLAGTLLLSTAQPQLSALDLRSSWNRKQPCTPTGVRTRAVHVKHQHPVSCSQLQAYKDTAQHPRAVASGGLWPAEVRVYRRRSWLQVL